MVEGYRAITFVAAALLTACGGESGEQSKVTQQTSAISDEAIVPPYDCWQRQVTRENRSFRGAVAIYRKNGARVALLFSIYCPLSKAPTFEPSTIVLLHSVNDPSNGSGRIPPGPYLTEVSTSTIRLGVSPEWPEDVYAVHGVVKGLRKGSGGAIVVQELTVDKKQRMPSEIYGQFLASPDDQKSLVSRYLDYDFYDDKGYRITW